MNSNFEHDDANPYQAPLSPPADRPADMPGTRIGGFRVLLGWLFVFLGNLPIPLMFGNSLTRGNARLGMVGGTVLLGLVGGVFCRRSHRIGMSMIIGGGVVAMTQFMAIPQFAAGMAGLIVSEGLGLTDPEFDVGRNSMTQWPAGLVTTLVSGSLLMAMALAIGLVVQFLWPSSRGIKFMKQNNPEP